jgi:pilus assembly protein CpaB
VDELVGAGNRILPGDFVDVFLNLRNAQPSISSPAEAAQTRLLLSRLRVLSYGQQDIAPVAIEPPPAARPTPATTRARPTSPAVAAATARQ